MILGKEKALEPLLSVRNLYISFKTEQGLAVAVEGASFDVRPGEVLGLVGESGSGKSITLRSILRLVKGAAKISGNIFWRGRDLAALSQKDVRDIRGREISMIFQEPMTALNPVLSIGTQILDNLKEHTQLSSAERQSRAIGLLDLVGIPDAKSRIDDFPHRFSGGMRQRVMIAISLASFPMLLLADEPTTALDVTIQDQVLKLLLRLRNELNMSMILVTHDLGVVAQTCDRVAVMYAGLIVESGPVIDVLEQPRHAYTLGLLNSIPMTRGKTKKDLRPIPGTPPIIYDRPVGCPFAPRCDYMTTDCTQKPPELTVVASDHVTSCLHYEHLGAPGFAS